MRRRFVHRAVLGMSLICQLSVCLDFVPRFDGLIAANGRLYVSTLDGKVRWLSGAQGQPLPPAEDAVMAVRKITEQTP